MKFDLTWPQAVKKMIEGEWCVSEDFPSLKQSFIDDKLKSKNLHDGSVVDNQYFSPEEMKNMWAIYEKPKEKKSYFDVVGVIASDCSILSRVDLGLGLSSNKSMRDTANAFITFIKLKAHPLAVACEDNVRQYFIAATNDLNNLKDFYFDPYVYLSSKLNFISPAFNTKEDARKAVEDIGRFELLHMLKYFQGVK